MATRVEIHRIDEYEFLALAQKADIVVLQMPEADKYWKAMILDATKPFSIALAHEDHHIEPAVWNLDEKRTLVGVVERLYLLVDGEIDRTVTLPCRFF